MEYIVLDDIQNYALKKLSVQFPKEKISVILGPNGSGKTTLLNVIAGLVNFEGKVFIDERDVSHIPPYKRNISYIFQGNNLFPHLTVRDNLLFPFRIKRIPVDEKRFYKVCNELNITHLLQKFPATLSGGEHQRVTLARTILKSPQIVLMDEPFSSLDLKTVKYLRSEIKFLQRRYKLTIIFVTHNIYEAEELADELYILESGSLIARGPYHKIFYEERAKVEHIFGRLNIFPVRQCRPLASGLQQVFISDKVSLVVPYEKPKISKLIVDPKDVYVSPVLPPPPHINLKQGRILKIEHLKYNSLLHIQLQEDERVIFLSEMSADTLEELSLKEQDEVYLIVKLSRIRVH